MRALVRGTNDDQALSRAIAGIWHARRDRYSEMRTAATTAVRKIEMSYIGG
jgi:cyclic pyranopterin phosphate synthase